MACRPMRRPAPVRLISQIRIGLPTGESGRGRPCSSSMLRCLALIRRIIQWSALCALVRDAPPVADVGEPSLARRAPARRVAAEQSGAEQS